MDKRIGRVIGLILIVLSAALCADPIVKLEVTDSNGDRLEQAQIHIPFVVHVTVSNDNENLPTPSVEGLNQFQIEGSNSAISTSIYNGKKSVSKTFQIHVIADQQGEYTLGPATIEHNGVTKKSDSIRLKIGREQKTNNQEEQQAFAVISFDHSKVYVGQELLFTLRFYYANNQTRLSGIREPTFQDFTLLKLEGPTTGTRTMDDKQYHYLEWNGKVFPEKSGKLIVPPVEAVYTVPSHRSMGFFGDVSSFFGGANQARKIYSNALDIDVLELPEYDVPVTAVGQFSSISAHLNNTTAQEGEGVVLTFELIGSGNLNQIAHPPLTLPQEVTFYESSAHVSQSGHLSKKTFEYILQGLSDGTYAIEPQTFTYFDPQQEKYKTLKTNPLSLTIKKSVGQKKKETFEDKEQSVSGEPVFNATILNSGAWKAIKRRQLSPFVFFTLLLFPFFITILNFLKKRRQSYLEAHAPELRYKNAFKEAHMALNRARKGSYSGQLYHIFIELFAARLKLPKTEISENVIEDTLRSAGVSNEALIKWRLLFAHMAEEAFSSYGTTQRNDGLFNQAAHWLGELEKII